MNAKLQRRLEQLEDSLHVGHRNVIQQIEKAALTATSTEDLELMCASQERGALYSECTAEEKAAWERYSEHAEAAALRITGQPLSRLGGIGHHRRAAT